ncbi:hypothetical protein BGX30_009177 [Mortierella sp. GBA39]|nr:hypothetical protein BGX30_009177 [Mortierella sp. GBA39]
MYTITKMTATTPSKNLFDSSDLRFRLSRFLNIKDATSYARGSKARSDTFTSVIWGQDRLQSPVSIRQPPN